MRKKDQLLKLVSKLQSLSLQLKKEQSVGVHQNINHFHYMQKIEELNFLMAKFDDLNEQLANLNEVLDREYNQAFVQWRKDLRFLNSYHRSRPRSPSIL